MPGIAAPNVIDYVAVAANGAVVLAIVESHAWTGDAQAEALRAKLNGYLNFILGGDLVRKHPQLKGKPVEIELACPTAPTGELKKILELTEAVADEHGIRFRLKVDPKLAG